MKLTILLTSKRNKIFLLILLLALIVSIGIFYLLYQSRHPSTDDAYVNANVINIAPQVSGSISKIYFNNHQFVTSGQILFLIDPRPFQFAVDQARANLALAWQEMHANQDAVQVARAQVNLSQAQLTWAQKNAWRLITLAKEGQGSLADADQAQEQWDQARASLVAAQSQLSQAIQNLGQPGANNAKIKAAQAALKTAILNLSYTKVTAPTSGYIENFTLRIGSVVNANQPLFQLIANNEWWVDANFKETQLKHIKSNQVAIIKLDIYPGVQFKGRVESIGYGSGSSFSLLPPENATGNWVKVTQRFPVKVIFLKPDDRYPLRVGASSIITIDTTS